MPVQIQDTPNRAIHFSTLFQKDRWNTPVVGLLSEQNYRQKMRGLVLRQGCRHFSPANRGCHPAGMPVSGGQSHNCSSVKAPMVIMPSIPMLTSASLGEAGAKSRKKKRRRCDQVALIRRRRLLLIHSSYFLLLLLRLIQKLLNTWAIAIRRLRIP